MTPATGKPTVNGVEVRKLRDALGLTQHELARILDVDPSTPSRWERGQHSPKRGTILFLQMLLMSKDMGEKFAAIREEAAAA